jgi:hypothetical protein
MAASVSFHVTSPAWLMRVVLPPQNSHDSIKHVADVFGAGAPGGSIILLQFVPHRAAVEQDTRNGGRTRRCSE